MSRWAAETHANKYGGSLQVGSHVATRDAVAVTAVSGPGAASALAGHSPMPSRLSPDHPLFWVFGIMALTFGLAGASASVHAGPVRAGASAGK